MSPNEEKPFIPIGTENQPLSYTKLVESSTGDGISGWVGIARDSSEQSLLIAATFTQIKVVPGPTGKKSVTLHFTANNDKTVDALKVIRQYERAGKGFRITIVEPPKRVFSGHFTMLIMRNSMLTRVSSDDDHHEWEVTAGEISNLHTK